MNVIHIYRDSLETDNTADKLLYNFNQSDLPSSSNPHNFPPVAAYNDSNT